MDIKAVDIKVGEGVSLVQGDAMTFETTVTLDGEEVVATESGPAYVEHDGVLRVYPDWQRPFADS